MCVSERKRGGSIIVARESCIDISEIEHRGTYSESEIDKWLAVGGWGGEIGVDVACRCRDRGDRD